jgi:hypothetical protein
MITPVLCNSSSRFCNFHLLPASLVIDNRYIYISLHQIRGKIAKKEKGETRQGKNESGREF